MKSWRVTVFVLLLSSAMAAAAGPASRPVQLTVATYNINYGVEAPRDMAEVARIIQQSDADVVGIQESSPALQAYLRKELAKTYPVIQFNPGQGAGSFGWLSRYPLENPRVIAHKEGQGYFNTPVATIKLGEIAVQLVTVHLMPTLPHQGDTMRSMLARIMETDGVRDKEIHYIWSQLPAGGPMLVLGDFNSGSFMAAPAFLAGKNLIDSFAAVTKDADLIPSWHWPASNGEYTYRLDYIFHSGEFKTKESRIIAAGPSDHYMVVSRMELVGPTTKP